MDLILDLNIIKSLLAAGEKWFVFWDYSLLNAKHFRLAGEEYCLILSNKWTSVSNQQTPDIDKCA